jgi:thioredoxin reductase (NADPH)
MKDIVIIGAGPAGLSAALYGARAGMDLVVIDSNYMAGGQVLTTYEVDNYLGLPGINGFDMGMKFQEHVVKLGVEILSYTVENIEYVKDQNGKLAMPYFVVHTEQGDISCKTVLLATGAVNRKLDIPGEEAFLGRGVGYCATCDGAFYRGKVTAVVGGSYQAVEDAIYLAGLCEKVYLIHRRDKLRAGAVLEGQLMKLPNVEIIWDSIPLEIAGSRAVETILLKNVKSEEEQELKVDGVFVAIGTQPSTALAKELVELDEQGYVIAGENGETSLAGFYVAGDIRTKQLRQIVTAVADGANAVTTAWNYVEHMK